MKVRRPELVLAAAVAICLPMVPGILSGAISPASALVRLLIALVICWVAGSVLTSVFDRYAEESRRAQIIRMIEKARQSRADVDAGGQGQGSAHVRSQREHPLT